MPLFRRKREQSRVEAGPEQSLDELIAFAKRSIEERASVLEPDEDWLPMLDVSGRGGTSRSALAVGGGELGRVLAELTAEADRWVFSATAWQAEDVHDPSVPASQHPDRFEVVLVQAQEDDRQEVWRARIERRERASPVLGEWERLEDGALGQPRVPQDFDALRETAQAFVDGPEATAAGALLVTPRGLGRADFTDELAAAASVADVVREIEQAARAERAERYAFWLQSARGDDRVVFLHLREDDLREVWVRAAGGGEWEAA
jgi:hypothetical protein